MARSEDDDFRALDGNAIGDEPPPEPRRRASHPGAEPEGRRPVRPRTSDGRPEDGTWYHDQEYQRPSYLVEADPHATFDTDELTAPPVIGE